MRKIFVYLFALCLFCNHHSLTAQSPVPVAKLVKEEQTLFMRQLKSSSTDTAIVNPLAIYAETEINKINASLSGLAILSAEEKEKAIRSLAYFIKELSKSIVQQKATIYEIPAAIQSYKIVQAALFEHKSLAPLLAPLSANRNQLLATSFSQYKESSQMDERAVYKRVAESPAFILQFLENKLNFRFADSLILVVAAQAPTKLINYLRHGKPQLQDRIRRTNNKYLQQIILISGDKNFSEELPFVMQLAENNITQKEIADSRMNVQAYFQLLVNTLSSSLQSNESNSPFLKLLRNGIKEKSLSFYVSPINDQHNAAEVVRFSPVKGLRAEDLYYIITSCGEELYTSSYLGLYKRLMEHFPEQSADSLFGLVRNDNFRTFMRLSANYNTLGDFLGRMSPASRAGLLKRFIAGVESNYNAGLEKAMDIADCFMALAPVPENLALVEKELQSNLARCKAGQQFLGIQLYSILLRVFDLVKQPGTMNKLWATLGNYEKLDRKELSNKKGEIVELVLFYGDEDGTASFSNFSKLYTDSSKWTTTRNSNWISIRSLSGHPLLIYANLPLDEKEDRDLKAQDSLVAFLDQQSLEPAVIVHRGHSYHLEKTLKRLTPSVKLAILGSCGSYNNAISIANINPDVQVIASKKTGAKSVNDPIIEEINEVLLTRNELLWADVWNKLTTRFSKDEFTLGVFNEYIPPSKNISLFVLKLFNYYNRFA